MRMLGLFMVMPVLAILATDYAGYSALTVGLAIGAYGLTQAILQIPMGVLSDKIGRKPVIVAGLLLFAAGSALAATSDSMWGVIAGRLLQGAGAIAGAVMALAGDVSREEQRPKVMAIIGVAIGFSFYLALLLGPLLADVSGLPGVFGVTAGLALVCVPVIIWLVPSAVNTAPSGDTLPVAQDVKRLFTHPHLLRLNLGVMLLHLLITLMFVQLPTMLADQGMPLAEHWQLYLPILIGSVFAMALLMRFATPGNNLRMLLIAAALIGLGCFVIATDVTAFWLVAAGLWLFFTGFNYLEANFPAMVSSIAPAGKKGSAMGVYASFQFFGAFAGGVISGLLNELFMPQWVFVAAGLLCLMWPLILTGINSAQGQKRYTLSVNLTAQSAEEIGRKLADLDGVTDITVVPDEQIAYLKVDGQQFDLRQARQLAGAE